jgi:protein-S-isoprenylcysteine O-methyltransferase Ste14
MSEEPARRATIQPPLLFILLLFMSFGAEWFYSFPFPEIFERVRWWYAGACFVAGTSLGGWAFISMLKCGTPVQPGLPAKKLVICGPFRFTRNPLYITLILWFQFFMALSNSVWYLFAAANLAFVLHNKVVKPEEKYLLERFGKEYEDYQTKVRRWI